MASSTPSTVGRHGNNAWAPYNIGILIIDEDPTSLFFVATVLQTCYYRVASFGNPLEALRELCSNIEDYDLVIADLHMVKMPGFSLVEQVARGMRIPVITTCADENSQLLHQALDCGACFHLVKPITINGMEFIWKKSWLTKAKSPFNGPPKVLNIITDRIKVPSCEIHCGTSTGKRVLQIGTSSYKKVAKDELSSMMKKDEDLDCEDISRTRLQWDVELHQRFLVALALLGNDAVPSSIIGIMNVAGLTTKQVASHLQKHRKRMQKEKKSKEKQLKYPPQKITAQNLPTVSAPPAWSNKMHSHTFINNNQNHAENLPISEYQNYPENLPTSQCQSTKTPFILPNPQVKIPNTTTGYFGTNIGARTNNQSSSFLNNTVTRSKSSNFYPMNIYYNAIDNATTEPTALHQYCGGEVEPNTGSSISTHQPISSHAVSNPFDFNNYERTSSTQFTCQPSSGHAVGDPLDFNNFEGNCSTEFTYQPSSSHAVTDQYNFNDYEGTSSTQFTYQPSSSHAVSYIFNLDDNEGISSTQFTYQPSSSHAVSDQFNFNNYEGASSTQFCDSVLPSNNVDPLQGTVTVQRNVGPETTKKPVTDEWNTDWPGLDEFLGIDAPQEVKKDQTDAGVGPSKDFDFGFGFDNDFNSFKELTFDDAALAEMLDQLAKGKLP